MVRVTEKPARRDRSIVRAVSCSAVLLASISVAREGAAQARSATTAVSVEVPRENRVLVYPFGAGDPQQAGQRCDTTCSLDLAPGEYVVEYAPVRPESAGSDTVSRRFAVGRSPVRVVRRGRPVASTALLAIGGASLTVGIVLGAAAIIGSITHFGPDPTRSWAAEGIAGGVCFGVGWALFVPGVVISNPIAVEPLDDGARVEARVDRRVRWSVAPGAVGTPFGASVAIVYF